MSNHETIISELHAYQGDIFRELTLPAQGAAVSRVFRGSGIQSGTRIVAAALTDFALKEGEQLMFELQESDSGKGPFFRRNIIATISGSKCYVPGDEIMRFTPEKGTRRFLRLKVSDNADLSSSVITAYLVRKS
ncbi:MAG: hypothetical protein E7040_05950 [Lentisphaerae bacterium]|nr:hypothetical protein [Lentisphaerota bacterium]